MNVPATIAVGLPAAPAIARTELQRIEGLGDNCELGFVLRRQGFEDGMLFRWASVTPESLLATFRGDFRALYEFDDLVPQNSKMVRDLHYGTAWHTRMYSSLRNGELVFDADVATRRAMHVDEAGKLAYLTEKLRRKFLHPNPVFVIKANKGIDPRTLESIHYQLYRRVVSPNFQLVEVACDPEKAGLVERIDRNLMRGYVRWFAGYDSADQGDDESWLRVLAAALSEHVGVQAAVAVPRILQLPFPIARNGKYSEPVPGDLRGGACVLVRGNDWCRVVDDGAYRLHALDVAPAATALRWTGVYMGGGFTLTANAACAIEESVPVRTRLEAVAADGTILRSERIFEGMGRQSISLSGPAKPLSPWTVTLAVEPLAPLRMGQRAVIDIGAVQADI